MPLYSNTTTGNNQVTYTASEQVTKILPFDAPHLKTGNNYSQVRNWTINKSLFTNDTANQCKTFGWNMECINAMFFFV